MGGIAVLMPNEELLELALEMAKENKNIIICKRITKDVAVEEAQKAVEAGARVIVARGHQASLIEEAVNIPVSEIVWTAQEIGLTIVEARKQIEKEKPVIGIIGLMSMFCDISYFEELHGVGIKSFFYEVIEQSEEAIRWIENEKVDAVIGENGIMEKVNTRIPGLPTIPMVVTGESLQIAIRYADTLYRAGEMERHNKAQMYSLLDSAFNGLLQIDDGGKIVMMNRIMEGIMQKGQDDVLGKNVRDVVSEINVKLLEQALHSPMESFSTFLNVNGNATVMISSPIAVGNDITGAYLSFKRIRKDEEINFVIRDAEASKKFRAFKTFDSIQYKSKQMHEVIERAKLYAQSNTPIMICGQSGEDRESICQGIHNYSPRKQGPYVSISLVGLSEERQLDMLFGNGKVERRGEESTIGVLEKADGGTLVINGIGFITKRTQSALNRFIRETSAILKGNGEMKVVDVHIIITSSEDINYMNENNDITETFYYIFSGLVLKVPSFKDREEDIENYIRVYMERYTQKYSRYQVLSAEAMEYLMHYTWKGSAIQIERFVERMVLTVEKRTIKKTMVESLLQEMYPEIVVRNEETYEGCANTDKYEEMLRETFVKCKGKRNEVAKVLGISTTTLWRKMKKYGISD